MKKPETATEATMNELILKLVEDGVATYFRFDNPEKFWEEHAKKRDKPWGLHPPLEDLKEICCLGYMIDQETFERAITEPNPKKWEYRDGPKCELYVVKGYKEKKVVPYSEHVLRMKIITSK